MRIITMVRNLKLRGMQRAAQTTSLAYQRAGHEVLVLSYADDGPRRRILERASVKVLSHPRDLESCVKEAESFAPDLIQLHRSGSYSPVEANILRRLRRNGHPVVLETSSFGRVDYSEDAGLIDVHMPKSLFCLWRWRRWLGQARRAQVGVFMPNPVETLNFTRASVDEALEQRRSWRVPDDAYLCGHVGYKSSPLMLRGYERLAKDDESAWLAWVDPPAHAIGWIDALPISVRRRVVRVPRTLDDSQLKRTYSAFNCFLHDSTIGETFGYVLAEALMCGVPIVSLSRPSRDNGHLELIGHGEGGLIAGQPRYYPQAVRQIRQDEAFRKQIVEDGPKRVRARYDADLVAALTLRVGELAIEHRNGVDLQAALDLEPGLRTKVNDDEIMGLLRNTLGGLRMRDLAAMRLVTSAMGHRLVRILKHREKAAMTLRFRSGRGNGT